MNEISTNYVSTVEERDTDLFFKIADIIDFTPEQYAQETWGEFAPTDEDRHKFADTYTVAPWTGMDSKWQEIDCGSRMCVAGWAVNLSGYLPYVQQKIDSRFDDGRKVYILDWGTVNKRTDLHEVQPTQSTSSIATELLGITESESDILFHGDYEWTGDDLRAFGKGEAIIWYGPIDGSDDD